MSKELLQVAIFRFNPQFFLVLSMVVSGSLKRWDRYHIITQLAGRIPHILPSGGLYGTYHLLGEPGNSIDFGFCQWYFQGPPIMRPLKMVSFPYYSHIFRDSRLGVVWESHWCWVLQLGDWCVFTYTLNWLWYYKVNIHITRAMDAMGFSTFQLQGLLFLHARYFEGNPSKSYLFGIKFNPPKMAKWNDPWW